MSESIREEIQEFKEHELKKQLDSFRKNNAKSSTGPMVF